MNLSTVLVTLGQNLIFTALITRHWSAQVFGQWLSLEAAISLLLVMPSVLADLVGYELLRASDSGQRHAIYRLGALGAYGLVLLLLPASALLLLVRFPVSPPLLLGYTGLRLLGQPILGSMSKRFYSDGRLSLSFCLGALDQLLFLGPAALSASVGWGFAHAIAAASLLRAVQASFQGALLQRFFPWEAPHAPTEWSVLRLWRRMLMLTPASLPASLIQNGISLATAALLGQSQLAVFSTHRTAAGFLGQFGNALIEPRIPELLREPQPLPAASALATRCLPVVAGFIPLMLVAFPVVYQFWLGPTWRPHVMLFGMLLLVQLIRVLQQPFATIIRSRNEPLSALAEGWLPLLLIYGLLWSLHPRELVPFAAILLGAELMQWPVRWIFLNKPLLESPR